MRPSLFPSDDALPTWLHTSLCVAIVAPFAGFLLWFGLLAFVTGRLDPLSGPDVGQYFFGAKPLAGQAARLAGVSLLALGLAFLALGLSFTRLASDSMRMKLMPWVLLAASVVLGSGVSRPH